MTKSQTLALRRSSIRQRLNEIAGLEGDALTDEIRAECDRLTAEYRDVETRWRAATVSEGEELEKRAAEAGGETAEERETRELRGRIKLGAYFQAAAEERGVEGAEAEYNAARRLRNGYFPLDLLVEERATTNVDAEANQGTWLDRLFAESAATRLGVSFQSVMPGTAAYPVTSAGATGAQRGRGEAAADAAWSVSVKELKPTRNGVKATFSVEDSMRLPGLEEALRRDLGMALVDAVDRAIFLGDGDANEDTSDIVGLLTAPGVVAHTLTQGEKTVAQIVLGEFAGMLDGKHAGAFGDLNIVLAVGANTLWESQIIPAGQGLHPTTIGMFLRRAGLTFAARGDLDDGTADGDLGGFVGRARGIEGAAVAAVWESGQLIRDPYSEADKGQVSLVMNYLWSFGLPRASNFARVTFTA